MSVFFAGCVSFAALFECTFCTTMTQKWKVSKSGKTNSQFKMANVNCSTFKGLQIYESHITSSTATAGIEGLTECVVLCLNKNSNIGKPP